MASLLMTLSFDSKLAALQYDSGPKILPQADQQIIFELAGVQKRKSFECNPRDTGQNCKLIKFFKNKLNFI